MNERIRRFEDLIAWQKARTLTSAIYRVTSSGTFSRDFGLRDQIRRACVSVMSNVAEGHERCSPAEFRHFLRIAKGSCAEVRSQLYVALDVGYLPADEFGQIMEQADEVARLVGGLLTSIERKLEANRD